jgi:hypothetical protein
VPKLGTLVGVGSMFSFGSSSPYMLKEKPIIIKFLKPYPEQHEQIVASHRPPPPLELAKLKNRSTKSVYTEAAGG